MPDGILMSRRSSSGNYSKLKTKLNKILMLMCAGEAPTGLLGESLFEREIIEFHSTFSRHGNAQASLTLLIWLNEKVQKLSSKINRASRWNYLGARLWHAWVWSVLRTEIFQNLFRIKQNLDVRLKAYLYFGSLFEREINQKLSSKINQKLYREHRWCSLAWSRLRREIKQNFSQN